VANGENPWLRSHASYPTALPLGDGHIRVFFSPRDEQARSSVFSLDLALDGPHFERLGPPKGPWLIPGPRGSFDDSGASVSCVRAGLNGRLECWYLGWNLGVTVPFRTAVGLAVAAPDQDAFTRTSPAPALDRSAEDPFGLGYPWVLSAGEQLLMWYGTHLSWGPQGLDMQHAIRRAVSFDGLHWARDKVVALQPAGGEEFALSRPCVLRDLAGWHMWYCRRYAGYQLGFAYSADGIAWHRADAMIAFVGASNRWENGIQTYPSVFDHGGHRYMLYNGVGYGRSGFGLAMLDGDC
jgi:hypothetical protein